MRAARRFWGVSAGCSSFAFSAGWDTGLGASPDLEFRAGPPGGPYTTVASVPRKDTLEKEFGSVYEGWAAASEDFSKLILEVRDRALVPGHPTHTASGNDLYEYTGGELRQVNVSTAGATIGSCGAVIANGKAEPTGGGEAHSTRHAVSAGGSRVFFEAVPGGDCSEPRHLYMRVDGAETFDLGAYRFAAANAAGTKLLLERGTTVEAHEYFLYDTEAATLKPIFSTPKEPNAEGLTVSEDFTAIYFTSTARLTPEAPTPGGFYGEDLYRYDIPTGGLRFLAEVQDIHTVGYGPSRDGRYDYFESPRVAGVPGGATPSQEYGQLYRYDNVENVIECVSCASPFDPAPKQIIANLNVLSAGHRRTDNGMPRATMISANGDYAFFDTTAALVPQDIDGEIAPEQEAAGSEHQSEAFSLSSDVYEWRRDGLDGCAHVQGCLSLISSGRGGYLVLLLGVAEEGRDVFFTTTSQLVPSDDDSAVDIYDARIGGGFPSPPPRPVECEGDACSTPFAAPSDLTPSSATFHGIGDVQSATVPQAKTKPGKSRAAKKAKRSRRLKPKQRGKQSSRAKRAAHRSHGGAK